MARSLVVLPLMVLSFSACAAKKAETGELPQASVLSETPAGDGLNIQSIDINGDKQADVFNYVRPRSDAAPLLIRKETDLNWDGRIDVRAWFDEDGVLTKEEMDGDFDGHVDWTDHYQGTRRVMSEVDTDFDGVYDLFKYYEGAVLRRKERDSNKDGKVDLWEYFDDKGQVVKTGQDVDGDGVMDVRSE